MTEWKGSLQKIDDYRWEIPENYKSGMHVPGIIYASSEMLKNIVQDMAPEQVEPRIFFGKELSPPPEEVGCRNKRKLADDGLGVIYPSLLFRLQEKDFLIFITQRI